MRKVKEIELVFENCETMLLDYKYIRTLNIDNVKTNLNMGGIRNKAKNILDETYNCENFFIIINKSFNKNKYIPFGIDRFFIEQETHFSRILNNKDLVSIILHFKDGKTQNIYFPDSNMLKDEANYFEDNEWQSSKIIKNGHLLVWINKTQNDIEILDKTDKYTSLNPVINDIDSQ